MMMMMICFIFILYALLFLSGNTNDDDDDDDDECWFLECSLVHVFIMIKAHIEGNLFAEKAEET